MQKTKVAIPYIKTSDFAWIDYTTMWKNYKKKHHADYCKQNGEEIPSHKQLKAAHMNLYYRLVHCARKEMKLNNNTLKDTIECAAINTEDWFTVTVSKHLLAHILHTSTDSVKRHFKRLESAGIIAVSHDLFNKVTGREKRYREIAINPEMLLIFDWKNGDFTPTSQYLNETVLEAAPADKSANCIPVSSISTLQESNNNEIMDVDNVVLYGVSPSRDGLKVSTQRNTDKNITRQESTPKQVRIWDNAKEKTEKIAQETDLNAGKTAKNKNTKGSGAAAQQKSTQSTDKLTVMKRSFALDFFNFLMQSLFTSHNIYAAEKTKAIKYIEDYYFSTLRDENHGKILLQQYRWRISKAKSYVERTSFDFSNWYPCKYLNVHSTKGFAATKSWFEKSREDDMRKAELHEKQQKELSDRMLMDKAISMYEKSPGTDSFNQATEWLNNNHPHLYNNFIELMQTAYEYN